LLIQGRQGSGKSSLIRRICRDLTLDPSLYAYIHMIPTNELAEDRLSVVTDKLASAFTQASWKSPSILVLDDMDRLFPAEVEHADSTRSRQLIERFVSLMHRKMDRSGRSYPLVILASTNQTENLHPLLGQTHFFHQTLHLPAPGREERMKILEAQLTDVIRKGCVEMPQLNVEENEEDPLGHLDLTEISRGAEGYMPSDLGMVVQRSIQEWSIRRSEAELEEEISYRMDRHFSQVDLESALKGYIPVSLKGIPLQGSTVKWTDIGGLEEVKRILLETLEWPTKYAAIFANCPLRLRSGLLLYGYPGCGKTLLASAVARECGLNFVSVKGPELLNKYIGASEKSVRDLFERAQAAKPCVLFFDEFDSIAPRRGHDSTGVTDRVVNQMLTQMDGAEGLDGVYVLAATSRPDLIDPALLRPGRLDKSLFCHLPKSPEEIKEIFLALASQVEVDSSMKWEEVAEQCQGFTGADLQALIYNAHLLAIH
ncbi:P-loop containing nucleoside triphosphate hydrolase protein, partial [Piptocephalis cylindrospora]